MATRRRIQLELPKLDASEAQFRSALNDRMRRIQSMFDELDFPPAIQTVINSITQGTGLCVIQEIPEGSVDGINRTFYLSHEPKPALIWLKAGGLDMYPFDDYELTAAEGKVVYSAGAQPKTNEEHWVWYFCGNAVAPQQGVGTARFLDGGYESIDYGYDAAFDIKGDVSFGQWAKFQGDSIVPGVMFMFGYNKNLAADNSPYGITLAGSSNSWNIKWFHDVGGPGDADEAITFSTAIPNEAWRYVGLSRDVSAKTVYIYIGDGESIIQTLSSTYTSDTDNGTSTRRRLVVGNPSTVSDPGFSELSARYTVQEHYLSSTLWSEADHLAAMQGTPPSSGLLLSVGPSLGSSPEPDQSGNGYTGAVTGTTVVAGHP